MNASRALALAGVTLSLAVACRNDPTPRASGAARTHPDPQYLVREIEPTDSLWIGGELSEAILGTASADPSSTDSGRSRFGRLDGAEGEVLAGIDGVVATSDARLLVLDGRSSAIRIVNSEGHLLGSIGRPGRGPGDFFHAQSMALDERGNLYVGDMARRVQRFRPHGETFVLDTVLATTASPISLCLLGSMLVVHGIDVQDSSLIQVYDTDGRRLRSFGAVYRSPLQVINLEGARGRLACLPADRRIAYMPDGMIGELRVFTIEGATTRLAMLPGYRPMAVEELPDQGYQVTPPAAGFHHVSSLLAMPDGRILLQVALSTSESQKAGDDFASLLSIATTVEPSRQALSSKLGRVAAFVGRQPVFIVNDPTPGLAWTTEE